MLKKYLIFCVLIIHHTITHSQYHYGEYPSITTSLPQFDENNKETAMMGEEEEDKLDIKSEILLKISLAILAYKALAFNLVLFALIVIIPLLNPSYYEF